MRNPAQDRPREDYAGSETRSQGSFKGVLAVGAGFDPERILARTQGRQGWLREAHRQLERERWETAGAIPRSRSQRLRFAARQFEESLEAELRGNRAYEASREQRRGTRRIGGPPKPYTPPEVPHGEVNVTDPDSRRMKGNRRYIQGYNAQAVVNEQQIVIAAEISTAAGDFSQLRPMIEAALGELEQAGVTEKPMVAVADAQYWNEQHMDDVTSDHGIQVLIPPDSGKRNGERPGWTGGRYSFMRRVLATELGKELYRKRQQSIEPVYGHTKHNRRFDRFHRRGRVAVRTKAINHDESQPDQASPPLDRRPRSLKGPWRPTHRPTARPITAADARAPARAAAQRLCATATAELRSPSQMSIHEHTHASPAVSVRQSQHPRLT